MIELAHDSGYNSEKLQYFLSLFPRGEEITDQYNFEYDEEVKNHFIMLKIYYFKELVEDIEERSDEDSASEMEHEPYVMRDLSAPEPRSPATPDRLRNREPQSPFIRPRVPRSPATPLRTPSQTLPSRDTRSPVISSQTEPSRVEKLPPTFIIKSSTSESTVSSSRSTVSSSESTASSSSKRSRNDEDNTIEPMDTEPRYISRSINLFLI